MKKYSLKMFVLALVATISISSCVVHNREYRRPNYRNYHYRDHRDHDRSGNDHYDRHY